MLVPISSVLSVRPSAIQCLSRSSNQGWRAIVPDWQHPSACLWRVRPRSLTVRKCATTKTALPHIYLLSLLSLLFLSRQRLVSVSGRPKAFSSKEEKEEGRRKERAESREQRAESREQRAENREQRTELGANVYFLLLLRFCSLLRVCLSAYMACLECIERCSPQSRSRPR